MPIKEAKGEAAPRVTKTPVNGEAGGGSGGGEGKYLQLWSRLWALLLKYDFFSLWHMCFKGVPMSSSSY